MDISESRRSTLVIIFNLHMRDLFLLSGDGEVALSLLNVNPSAAPHPRPYPKSLPLYTFV